MRALVRLCPQATSGKMRRQSWTIPEVHDHFQVRVIGLYALSLTSEDARDLCKSLYLGIHRSFTPQPGGHEFRPGHDYFLISTSTGGRSGLMQQKGGACKHQNMRITFKICCRTRQPPNSEEDEAQHGTVPAPANASDRNATGLSKQLKSDERFSWETRQNLRLAENSVDTRNETKIDALTLTKTLAYGRRPQERSQSDHTTGN